MKLKIEHITLIVSLLAIVVLGAAILFHLTYYHSYVSVEATVIETYIDSGLGQGANDSSVKYVVVEYFRNDTRFTYKKQLGLFEKSSSIGDKLTIKCNIKNPEDVENPNILKGLIFVEIFLIVWTGGLLFTIIRKHQKGNKTYESQG